MFKKENIISCKDFVSKCKEEMKVYIDSLNKKPTLAVVQIDENPASCSYIKGKKKDCSEVGIKVFLINGTFCLIILEITSINAIIPICTSIVHNWVLAAE